jgi:argininosuccinate lyase
MTNADHPTPNRPVSAGQPSASAPERLWGGRFSAEPSPEMDRLNRSLPVDRRLWREDVQGSLAWATALVGAGVITSSEGDALRAGLETVGKRLGFWSDAEWAAAPDEDIHSLVERLLREEAGPVAGKLHTGRSRNDQVATDTRLWGLRAIERLDAAIAGLQRALVAQAERQLDTVLPAYTHLQRAQPVTAAHWLLSHVWPLVRDRERLAGAARRTSVLPLGSGAVAGCPFPIDRTRLQTALGFASVSPNSIDSVADRDWIAEILFVTALLGVHLSRLAEDLILFASAEFRFVRLSDRYSTGSSLMPQKRNPDALELARGKSGRLLGELTGFLTLLKGLPSGYNKDLQEDKVALFSALDTLELLLPAVAGTVESLEFDRERCFAAVDPGMLATELADFLVRRGVPFREAHELVGRLVRIAEESGCGINELRPEVFTSVSADFGSADLTTLFDPRRAIEARSTVGGTGSVLDQIPILKELL